MQQTDLQLTSDAEPNHIAVDETVIQIDDERNWLYAAVDSNTNEFLHGRLCQACTTERTMLWRREPREKVRSPTRRSSSITPTTSTLHWLD